MNNKLPALFLSTLGLTNVCQLVIADTTPLSLFEEKKLTLEQQLGKQIFFDKNLSSPAGQSCASCHDIKVSLTDPAQKLPVSIGAVAEHTGTRNTPSAAYSAFSPNFHFDTEELLPEVIRYNQQVAVREKQLAKVNEMRVEEIQKWQAHLHSDPTIKKRISISEITIANAIKSPRIFQLKEGLSY